jgi:hypothetical protein
MKTPALLRIKVCLLAELLAGNKTNLKLSVNWF